MPHEVLLVMEHLPFTFYENLLVKGNLSFML